MSSTAQPRSPEVSDPPEAASQIRAQEQEQQPDRISQILDYLNDPTLDTLPDSLRTFKYEDGFNPDKLEEELQSHPFFMTELPDPSKPLPPLLDAFQQLKYSETDNTPHELAENHKEDGMYHFKLKKYRIATTCFTTALSHELKSELPEPKFLATLYNNRSACSWFLQNYRSCAVDSEKALSHDRTYFKAFKRCVNAYAQVCKWEEVERVIAEYSFEPDNKEAYSFVCGMRVKARKGIVSGRASNQKEKVLEKKRNDAKLNLLEVVKARGVKLGDDAFLDCDAARDGKVVTLVGDNELRWPVLFMYPQYSQSDFIEAFSEHHEFILHIAEMLDGDNAPAWDVDREYSSSTVEVYYLSGKLVRVDLNSTLLSVMQQASYVLPGNGVACFFVLAKSNKFCEDFKERVELLE